MSILSHKTATGVCHAMVDFRKYSFNYVTTAKIINQIREISPSNQGLRNTLNRKQGQSNIPVRREPIKRCVLEPANIHAESQSLWAPIKRVSPEPSSINKTSVKPLAVKKRLPQINPRVKKSPTRINNQNTETKRSAEDIQKAIAEKNAARELLPEECKKFLSGKPAHKILTTYKNGIGGALEKKYIVVYEEFKQNLTELEKAEYYQAKTKGFSEENRFRYTKTVWTEYDKFKAEIAKKSIVLANNRHA